jgi:ubiquinone/menaquinone biosynthesis C-methylase UbiE
MNIQQSVMERYSGAAQTREAALCCPSPNYDRKLLALLPREIIEKDYGCGDPSPYVRPGDVVLDLGSGGGKICYLAAQLAGARGQVIGVDMNDDMLALARKYQPEMAQKLGGDRVRFVKGMIQDLALDLSAVENYLAQHPLTGTEDYLRFQDWLAQQRRNQPLIPDASVDLVISNCVLNLVRDQDKRQMVREIYRVLKPDGRIALSDIVSDETVPEQLKADPRLWSGCISGAFQEQEFLQAFVDAGFLAASYQKWETQPWRTEGGIEFRAVTLTAIKGESGLCLDIGQAVIYRGPFASVTDDEGHVFPRGERMAVCERTFRLLTEGPYQNDFIGITPVVPRTPVPWCAPSGTRRPASETKGATHTSACGTAGCC